MSNQKMPAPILDPEKASAIPVSRSPTYSVVMPVYNAAGYFNDVLDSIPDSLPNDVEFIVVDDCSSDGTANLIRAHSKFLRLRLVSMPKNAGPAAARNAGARAAKGHFLLFFDADVLFLPDTFDRIKAYVAEHPEVRCFTGINSRRSAAPGLISDFHALYSYYALDLIPEDGAASTWNPRVGFIYKELFHSIGGFDIAYRKADVEDYAFSKKIALITPIRFTRSFEIKHRFGGLTESTRNFFKRSRQWVRLVHRTRRLDTTGHTRVSNAPNLAVSALLAAAVAAAPLWFSPRSLGVLLAAHLALNARPSLLFSRAVGLPRAALYLILIVYFHCVALIGICAGILDLARSEKGGVA